MPEITSKIKTILPSPKFSVAKPNVILLSSQKIQEEQLNVASQNMSNAMTPGFKGFILSSEECVYHTKDKRKISYVKSGGMTRNMMDGAVNMTRSPLDFALSGAGYFAVRVTKDGVEQKQYTRNGRFGADTQGRLVDAFNHPVLTETGDEIQLPKDLSQFSIARDGTIFSDGRVAGKLAVMEFDKEQEMRMEGASLLSTKEEGRPATKAVITQGGFEESNVSVMEISIKLLDIMHRFEEAQLLIRQYEDLQKQTMNASPKNV